MHENPRQSTVLDRLTRFSWDTLAKARDIASQYPGGIINLSQGNPPDPAPDVARQGLERGSDSHGYMPSEGVGTVELRSAIAAWFRRTLNVTAADSTCVLPTIGAKEFLTWLPVLLGLGSRDVIALPRLAYPPYLIGAQVTGTTIIRSDNLDELPTDGTVRLIYVTTPHNPTGRIMGVDEQRALISWARKFGAIVLSDECYSEFAWTKPATSILSSQVSGDRYDNLIAINSLSKRSNMAGYRAGMAAGEPSLMKELGDVRSQFGMVVSGPVQSAMIAALGDDEHVIAQRSVYARRREVMMRAFKEAGWDVAPCEGGLYLWVTSPHDEYAGQAMQRLASVGVLTAPESMFGGDETARHLRVALTAVDTDIDEAARRISSAT